MKNFQFTDELRIWLEEFGRTEGDVEFDSNNKPFIRLLTGEREYLPGFDPLSSK
jgi:hypothetical protein